MTNTLKLSNTDAAVLGALFCEASLFASIEPMRPILTGVRFERTADGFLKLIATDSYVLGAFTTRVQVDEIESLVDAKQLAVIGKALAKLRAGYGDDRMAVELTFDERTFTVATDSWTLKADLIIGEFPNYSQLPAGEGNADTWPALNTTYLGLFGKLLLARPAPKRGKTASFGLRFECYGESKPVKFSGTSGHCDFLGLLMPVRVAPQR